jgi:hypothetical protein
MALAGLVRGGLCAAGGALLGTVYSVVAGEETAALPVLTVGCTYDNLRQDPQLIVFLSEIEETFKRVDFISYRRLVHFLDQLVGIYTKKQHDVYSLRYRSDSYMCMERCKESINRFRKLLEEQCFDAGSDICPRELYRVEATCNRILLVARSHMQLVFTPD